MRRSRAPLAACALVGVFLIPALASATTPYPRLLWKAEGEPDFDVGAAVEMVDDGTAGDAVAGDGLFTAEVTFPEDGDAPGTPRTFVYRVIPPDTEATAALGAASGADLPVHLPDGAERTVRFFFATARSTEIPATPACPDAETRLSCLGFGPIPAIFDDWNAGAEAFATGDHQADLGGTPWDASAAVVRLDDDGALGPLRRAMAFVAGRGFGGADGWQAVFDAPGGAWRLGPDGWTLPGEGMGTAFDLDSDPWRVVRFEVLPHRGMARQTVVDAPLPKPLLTEVVTAATAPFVEVHNPAPVPLALAGLHLTNHPGYPHLGTTPEAVDEAGFSVRFPDGAFVPAGAWFTVSLVDAAAFQGAYGRAPDYVLPGRSGATAMVAAHATPDAVGGSAALPEAGGFVGLVHLLPPLQRVVDVDLVVWGAPAAERALPDKSGLTTGPVTYGPDSMRAAASPAPAGLHLARRDFGEGTQRIGAGHNGIDDPAAGGRHDETDEPVDTTWALAPDPTPGEPPENFRFVIFGVVTAADSGEPVEGATVRVGGTTTTTNADGAYSLEVDEGTRTIEVEADGYEPASRTVVVDGDREEDFVIDREPGVVIAGRVRDDLGRWVSGARVDMVGGQRTRTQTTGDDGRFEFRGVAPNTLYTVTASRDGHRSDSRNLQVGEFDILDVLLTLVYVPISFTVSGRVVDVSTDDPIGGALVSLPALEATSTTNQAGEFTFRLVPPGAYAMNARAEGYAESGVEIEVVDDDVADIEIALGRDGLSLSLTGRVSIAGLDLPIAGASVQVVGAGDGPSRTEVTDHRGDYVILGLAPGRYEVTVTAPGYDPHRELIDLDLPTVHDVLLERRPDQGFSLAGTVQLADRDGGDWGGATVSLSPAEGDAGGAEARTDALGAYRFEDLPPGRYRVEASRSGYVPAGLTVVVAADTVQHFILQPTGEEAEGGLRGFFGCVSADGSGVLGALLVAGLWGLGLGRRGRRRAVRA
jgi:hypothetical protein